MSDTPHTSLAPVDRGEIDLSTRGPALVFFSSAVFWLFIGTVYALMTAFKFNFPEWAGESGAMTFGRLRPLHLNTMVYGWASMGAVGIAVWLMPRLVRNRLALGTLVYIAAFFWNLGMVLGTIALTIGDSKGLEWLEMPNYAVVFITLGFAFIGVSMFATFVRRRVHHMYVSNWYLLAAFIWFPLLYITANLPIYKGITQAAMNWWYAHNALGLWFTPIGLATIYYLIPKVTGKPVYSYYLSILGFWGLALFYNWNGIHHLVGGPVPSWLVTTSITASLLMAVPVIAVAINHHFTMKGAFHMVKESPTLRFMMYAGMSYTFVSLQGALQALRSYNEVIHFTHYVIAHAHIGLYAFFTMVVFGAYYYILPRLTGHDFRSKKLIKLHFWFTAIGILFYWISLQIGGVIQGYEMLNPEIPFIQVVINTSSWLWMRTCAGIILTIGHCIFIWVYIAYRMEARDAHPRFLRFLKARRATA